MVRTIAPMTTYGVELFIELNQAYRERPLVPHAKKISQPAEKLARGNARAEGLDKRYGLRGRRVLEVGCGRGAFSRVLAEAGCDVTGVDITHYPEWSAPSERLTFCKLDITSEDFSSLGTFDLIVSYSVWEHIRHPYKALCSAYQLLRPGGALQINANLYRGPKASHRYREVFFPWPHLLFTDEVFEQFYQRTHGKPNRPAWVNKLVAAEYLHYFSAIGFLTDRVAYNTTPIDEPFYERFADVLERYPRFDLERDFINAAVRRPP